VTLAKIKRLPTFKALESVVAALSPLAPEDRRKVIEATHSLLNISAGRQGQDQKTPKARASRIRSRRR